MARTIRAPRGNQLTCKNWLIEAVYRMLQNNLDPEVAGDPENLIVYGGRGKAARNWDCFEAILESLRQLEPNETLLVQSGKPVAIFTTHEDAPRVLIANSNIVPAWATQENFDRWEKEGLISYKGFAKDVRPFLQNADCLVFPSFYNEGIPRCLMEASSMELPVITSMITLRGINYFKC